MLFFNIFRGVNASRNEKTMATLFNVLKKVAVIPDDDDCNLVKTLSKMLTIIGVFIVLFFQKLLNGDRNFCECFC